MVKVKSAQSNRLRHWEILPVTTLFHTDAVQVAGRLPINVQQLPVDLLTLSSHKIYHSTGALGLYNLSGRLLL